MYNACLHLYDKIARCIVTVCNLFVYAMPRSQLSLLGSHAITEWACLTFGCASTMLDFFRILMGSIRLAGRLGFNSTQLGM